ncbi:hypothetical protein E3J61_03250 [Candidatus Dependentiae bacterium]|nr:MAG: hypothetical protein E3J61_03250 [Candidatus Dependentiae bacterium]
MKRSRKRHPLSKIILSFTATAVLLSSTQITQPTIGDTFRKVGSSIKATFKEKLPGLVSKTYSQVRGNLAPTFKKIKGWSKEAIIKSLQENVRRLGEQVGDIKDCMLFGFQCSAKQRATFYATAITVLALTAAVVGFTITVAATSKEPDQDLNKAIEATSQDVQGWKPAAVFQRLENRLTSFKENLLSMQQCLIKRQCTKRQKRALYSTAATIVALVTIAMGVGVGAYIYAEHKKAQEEADLPGEPVPGEEPPRKDGFRPSFTFDETPIKEGRLSKFQQFFRSKIQITKEKAQNLKAAYLEIKRQVQEGVIRTRRAAADKFLELVAKGKNFAELVQAVLEVNLATLHQSVQKAKGELSLFKKSLSTKTLQFRKGTFMAQYNDFSDYIKGITDKIEFIKAAGTSTTRALKRLADIKRKSVKYFEEKAEKLEAKGDAESKELAQKARMKIKVKQFLSKSNLEDLYPTIIRKINELKIYQVGAFADGVLRGLARLLTAARSIHLNAGKIGLIVSQDSIQDGLQKLRYALVGADMQGGLVATVKQALSNRPIIVTNQLGAIDLAKSLVKAATTTDKFGFLRAHFRDLLSINRSLKGLGDITDSMEEKVDQFTRDIAQIKEEAKRKFVEKIRANPLRGIPNAAAILRNALEEAVEKSRKAFDLLMKGSMEILVKVKDVTPTLFPVFQDLNTYLETATGKPFINSQLLQDLVPILTNTIPNIAEGAKKLRSKVEAIPAG